MIVCSKCKKFVSHVRYKQNTGTDAISDVTGYCTHCRRRQPCDWDCYEDIVGWPKE
jgi:hypothetical protein